MALTFEYFKMKVPFMKLVFFTKERLGLLGSCGFVVFKAEEILTSRNCKLI